MLGAGFSRNAQGHYEQCYNARLVKREYRKCERTFDSNSWNDLKLNGETVSLLFLFFFLCEIKLLSYECFPVNCFIHPSPPRLIFHVIKY